MNELNKIKEAEHFFSEMIKEKGDNNVFKFNLSAFLSSSRSVLQYTLKEASAKKGGQEWYTKQVTGNKVVRFLKDKRDINIHEMPISTKKDILIKLSEKIHISDSISIVVRDKDGNVKSQSTSELKPFKSAIKKDLVSIRYTFEDWSGAEDVFDICAEYLKEIKKIVEDGGDKNFLT